MARWDDARLSEILDTLRLNQDSASPTILVERRVGRAVWANQSAHRLFDASTLDEIDAALFRSIPAARAFAARLARLGPEPQLDRILVPDSWAATAVTATCTAVDGIDDQALAVIRVNAAPAGRRAPPQSAPEVTSHRGSDAGDRPVTADRRLRILWETDRDGVVTHLAREADEVTDLRLFAVGDHVVSWLQAQAPLVAEQVDRALRDHGSVGLTPLSWPSDRPGTPVDLALGCTTRPGLGGLRGFLLVRAPDRRAGLATEPASDAPVVRPPSDANGPAVEDMPAAMSQPTPPIPDALGVKSPVEPGAGARARDLTAAPTGGNVVHFPAARGGTVPAKAAADLRLAAEPSLDAPGETEIHWAESPERHATESPEELTADEQDAFAHIARVLGAKASVPAQNAPPLGSMPLAGPALPDATLELLAALPLGVLVRCGEQTAINAVLLRLLGDETVAAFHERFTTLDPTAPGALTRTDGTPVPATLSEVALGEQQARLVTVQLPEPPAARKPRKQVELPVATLDALTGGVFDVDGRGMVRSASASAGHLLGYEATELVGRPVTELLTPEMHIDWTAQAGRQRFTARSRTGQTFPIEAELVPSGAGVLCIVPNGGSMGTPVDDAEAGRREAERTSALKSEFLAKVSHEIRTPLNAILGFTEVIRDERLGPVGNNRYLEYLRDIHASGTHVLSLVNDLLDLSRIEAGRMDLRLEAVDANVVVQSCVSTLQTLAHRGRIIMRLSLAPHLPPALADERSLRQIVLNLLSNAVKFNEPGGQVIISTAPVGTDAVAIRIRDTGVGMTDDEVAAAMEPFRQISTVNRTGSGLGLPLTKALVEANCASMAIKSSRGEGTLVEVTFPLVEPDTMSLPA